MKLRFIRFAALALSLLVSASLLARPTKDDSILLIVTDPLARELACACVKGYGQRDYRKLAARLEAAVKQRVEIDFSDDVAETLKAVAPGRDVLIIGDESLVAHGATKAGFKIRAISELTDLEGDGTHTASVIVRSDDSARELKDVRGRKFLFGLAEADQKYMASVAALREAGVEVPDKQEKHFSYSDAALDLLDSDASPFPVAVVPSYAMRMLEGCGSVKPGNLRVIGKTKPSRFITVFISDRTPADKQQKIVKSLLAVKSDAKLLKTLETRDGFKVIDSGQGSSPKNSVSSDWPDWRGPNRDGHVPQLPMRLPATAKVVWKKAAVEGGLAGLSVSANRVISAERDFADENDVYRCFNAETGESLWRIAFPARGNLDLGQAPRATPVIHSDRAYLLGAFGDLRCVDLANGKLIWQRQLPGEFNATLPTWGMCSPPLTIGDLVIVNPGATNASLVALDAATGRTRWTTPGQPPAYSAFISTDVAGERQIIGYDKLSLGGWNPKNGKRLWKIIPPETDFNVPTPVALANGIIVATENNGARLYNFSSSRELRGAPAAHFAELAPDTATPVMTCGRLFGAKHQSLYCLDIERGLKPVWHCDEDALGDHSTFIADDERVLIITLGGELILIDAKADHYAVISRLRLFEEDVELYSHSAIVGSRLYARGGSSLICVDLSSEAL
jgi:outer membrane protein assembly factor BamB